MAKRTRRAADSDDATDDSDDDHEQQHRRQHRTSAGKRQTALQRNDRGKGKGKGRQPEPSDSDRDDAGDSDSDADADADVNKRNKAQLTDEEQKFYIQGMVRFVLFNESHRRVLRRQDLVKAVLPDGRGRHFGTLLPKVQKVLREVLGLDLCPLRPKESSSGKAQPKAYVVRSTVPLPLVRHLSTHRYPHLGSSQSTGHVDDSGGGGGGKKSLRAELAAWHADADADGKSVMRDVKREEGALYGILGVVLALILVNGNVLGDDQLVSYLKRLSLFPSTTVPQSLAVPNPDSLTLSQYLSRLVKQQYLERAASATAGGGGVGTQATAAAAAAASTGRSQRPRGGGKSRTDESGGSSSAGGDPAVEWRWGPRSEVEFGQVGIAHFIHRVFSDPESLPRSAPVAAVAGRDKFLKEVARAAGVKKLAGPGGLGRGRATLGDDDGDGEGEGGGESE